MDSGVRTLSRREKGLALHWQFPPAEADRVTNNRRSLETPKLKDRSTNWASLGGCLDKLYLPAGEPL